MNATLCSNGPAGKINSSNNNPGICSHCKRQCRSNSKSVKCGIFHNSKAYPCLLSHVCPQVPLSVAHNSASVSSGPSVPSAQESHSILSNSQPGPSSAQAALVHSKDLSSTNHAAVILPYQSRGSPTSTPRTRSSTSTPTSCPVNSTLPMNPNAASFEQL